MKSSITLFGLLFSSIAWTKPTLIQTQINIQANTEKVWAILMDFEQHANWNPFFIIEGQPITNKKLKITFIEEGKKSMTFKPKVLTNDLNENLTWKGHLIFPGLFDGKHQFILQANPDGTTSLIQREEFSGLFKTLILKQIKAKTLKNFELFNQAIKQRAEKMS